MPPLVHGTERSIRNLLEEVIKRFKRYEDLTVVPSDYISKIIEIDEIYIKIQGNREFYGWLAYDSENKYLIDFVTGKRDDDTLEELFKKLKKYKGKTEVVLVDAYRGYEKIIGKNLADGEKKPLSGVINKSQYTKTEGFVTYALFEQSKQSVENRMTSL